MCLSNSFNAFLSASFPFRSARSGSARSLSALAIAGFRSPGCKALEAKSSTSAAWSAYVLSPPSSGFLLIRSSLEKSIRHAAQANGGHASVFPGMQKAFFNFRFTSGAASVSSTFTSASTVPWPAGCKRSPKGATALTSGAVKPQASHCVTANRCAFSCCASQQSTTPGAFVSARTSAMCIKAANTWEAISRVSSGAKELRICSRLHLRPALMAEIQ
mmetsp:Transcript_5340/g.15911  ORF Transcript_5340/g.15911 Transcript_5340/m.15911 type:complete len:217 (+) Transcript_5340:179-829(+)